MKPSGLGLLFDGSFFFFFFKIRLSLLLLISLLIFSTFWFDLGKWYVS